MLSALSSLCIFADAIGLSAKCQMQSFETPPQDTRQSIAKQPGIFGAFSIEYPRLIEQQLCRVLFERPIVITQRCELQDDVVTWIDFQYRFRGRLKPS